MNAFLRFDSVSCVRGGRLLFDGLNLVASPEQAIEVAGPNGSGKSSLLRLAAGLLDPVAGTVQRDARAGLVDERIAFDAAQGLRQALKFWAKVDGSPAQAIDPALDAMGITHLADVPVRLLSTGQRKRAAFARLLAAPSPLWLLDEPLNGLDADGVARVTTEIRTHLGGGNAVLYASHQPIDTLFNRQRIKLGQ